MGHSSIFFFEFDDTNRAILMLNFEITLVEMVEIVIEIRVKML